MLNSRELDKSIIWTDTPGNRDLGGVVLNDPRILTGIKEAFSTSLSTGWGEQDTKFEGVMAIFSAR